MEAYSSESVMLSIVVGSVITIASVLWLKKYMAGGVCRCTTKLNGKTAIITGSNTGIGKETAKDLIKRGARVIMACRNMEKAKVAADDIRNATGCGTRLMEMKLDLSDLQSVRDFAAAVNKDERALHILINNAGVMWTPYSKTKDGFEMQMGTNHFGHFLLTMLLLDLLKKSAPSRIVNLSSLAHNWGHIKFDDINCEKSYKRTLAYSDSKLANVLFTRELSKRLEGTNVTVNALHPGVVESELMRYTPIMAFIRKLSAPFRWVGEKSTLQGAQTSIHVAVSPNLHDTSGQYFSDCKVKTPAKLARDDVVAAKLWKLSEKLTGL